MIKHIEKCIEMVEEFDEKYAPGRHKDNRIRQSQKKLNKYKKRLKKQGRKCEE